MVRIPASRGCEKKVWFDLNKDIKAVLVKKGDLEKVYMITEAASKEYKGLTGHDRMPRLIDKQEVPMLRRMFLRRLRGYKAIGYSLQEEQLSNSTPELKSSRQEVAYLAEEGV